MVHSFVSGGTTSSAEDQALIDAGEFEYPEKNYNLPTL